MKVSVIGLGKAGLPLAAVIADAGLDVIGLDIDQKRVDMLNRGENPLPEEKGLGNILKERSGKNFKATTSYEEAVSNCNAHIVIVPLFIDENKKCDFSILENAFSNISKFLKEGDLVILETTVPVGTTEKLALETLDTAGVKYHLGYSPERIMTGYSISRYKEFPKVVSGRDVKAGKKVEELYSQFCKRVSLVSNIKTAEMVKISEGIYRDVNIALANELFKVCKETDVNFWEMQMAAKHEFCHIHEPGNVGGHCIPVYPWFLINNHDVPLIKIARELNDDMIIYYADVVSNIVKTGKVGLIGLSYREGVKEKAYTRSIPFIKLLKERGYDVYGLDPLYNKEEIKDEFGVDQIENLNEMDAIVLMNKEQKYISLLEPIKKRVVDVKNILN